MNRIEVPNNLLELTYAAATVAIQPSKYTFVKDGSVDRGWKSVSFKNSCEGIFQLFEKYFDKSEAGLMLSKRFLSHLNTIRAKNCGQVDADLKRLISKVSKVVDPLISGKEEKVLDVNVLSADSCQQMLSALYAEKRMFEEWQWQLTVVEQGLFIEEELTRIGSKPTKKPGFNSVIANAQISDESLNDSHLLSAFLRYADSNVLKRDDHGIQLGLVNRKLHDELQKLLKDGLILPQSEKIVRMTSLMYRRDINSGVEETTALACGEAVANCIKALRMLKVNSDFMSLSKRIGSFIVEYANVEAEKEGTDEYSESYSREFCSKMDGFLNEYSDSYPTKLKLYQALWSRLAATKNQFKDRREYYQYTKILGSLDLLPKPADFGGTWEHKIEKVAPKRPKKKSSSLKKKKGKGRKARAPTYSQRQEKLKQITQPVKVKPPKKIIPVHKSFLYADRVQKLLDLPINGLDTNRLHHAFGLAVDPFVMELGVKTVWKNTKTGKPDLLFSIPGEIIKSGKSERGVFTYCFEADNINKCYHRCFMKKTADDVVMEFMEKGCWNVDFPKLKKEENVIYPESPSKEQDKSRFSKEERNIIEIEDPRNQMTIRLFRVK